MNRSITAQILEQSKELLHKDLEPKELLEYLLGVIKDDDRAEIRRLATRKERVAYFIPCYVRICPDLDPLLKALRSSGQNYIEAYLLEIRKLLINQQPDTHSKHLSPEDLEIILRSGDVPQKLVGFVARSKLLVKFKAALRKIQSSIGWVLFYGMGGSGKSVFAAASMHDPEIIGPGQMFERVFWLRVGHIEESVRETRVKSLLHSLLVRLDPDFKSTLVTLDEGKTRVQKLLLDRHPRCLLIFDDVWSHEVVQLLNLQCRTLVISRNSDLLDVVTGTVEKVAIDDGFAVEESLEAFAKMLNVDKNQLPSEATEISTTCGGLPFVIALIAALLKDNPKRWNYYLKMLKDPKSISKIRKQTMYMHDTVFSAVEMSVNDLQIFHREVYDRFLSLVVFNYAHSVPITVLCLYWNLDQEDAEDEMGQICSRSLAIKECSSEGHPVYVVHDIIKSYLSAICADKKQECHRQLINAYKDKYPQGYHTYPRDNYIQRELGTHLYEAKMQAELPSALLDLKFIQEKLATCGPTNTLGDIVKFWNILIKEKHHEKDTVEIYQFISRNASQFVDLDPVQLALLESNKSAPCSQAKEIVAECMKNSSSRGKLYFQLMNKKARKDHLLISSMRPHSACVKTLAFLPNGSLFVSGGSDNTVKLSHIRTGEEIASVGYQLFPVSCVCLYVPLKKVVVTDGPVLKLYDISHCWETDLISLRASGGSEEARKVHTPTPTRRNFNSGLRRESETELVDAQPTPKDTAELLLNGHDGEILWCEFASGSSNNRYPLLASCGTDNTVRIWDLNVIENHTDHGNTSNIVNATSASKPEIISQTPKVARSVSVSLQLINTLKGHTGAVKYCRFAPNDLQDLIASASEDRTVRIWSVSKGIHLQILEHSSDISFLCWSHAGVSKDCIISMDQNKLGVWQKLPQGGGQLCFSLLDNFELVPGTKATGGMISPDGETLAIGFSDGNVEIWDLQKVMKKAFSATCKLSCLTGHSGAITSLCYSSDSKTLLTAANDSVLLWSTEPTEIGVTLLPPYVTFLRSDHSPMILARSYVTREVTERDSSLRSVDYYTDPDVVKRRGGQDHLVLLEGTTESIFATFKSPSPTAKIMSVGVASIGDFAAVGYDNGQVFTVTVEENKGDEQPFKMTGQMLTTHSGAVTFISFSNCNSVFATCGSDGLTNVWRRSLTSNEITQVSVFNDVPGLVNRAVFFPNSTDKIMICSENGRVNVWNCTNYSAQRVFSKIHGVASVLDCDVSNNGTHLVSASSDFTSSNCAAVWDLTTLELHISIADGTESSTATIRRPGRGKSASGLLLGSSFPARCCRFSPSGKLVAVGFDSGRVQIWSVVEKTLKTVITANPMNEWVRSVRISPDDQILVTAGSSMMKWWSLEGTAGNSISEQGHLQKFPLRAAAIDYLFVNDEVNQSGQTKLAADMIDGNAAGVHLRRTRPKDKKPLAPFSLFVAVSTVGTVVILKRLTEGDMGD